MEKTSRPTSILITCLVFVGMAALFTVLAQTGFKQLQREEQRRDQLARLVQQLEARKAALEKERDGLANDPVYVEREARRLLGYVKEDEKAVDRPPLPLNTGWKEEGAPVERGPRPWIEHVRGWIGTWHMTLAVILAILVALAAAFAFGGHWRTSAPDAPKNETPKQ